MTSNPVVVRPARREDIPCLVDFACAMAWETEHKRLDPDVVRRGTEAVFERPQRGRYLVAERNGEVVGSLMVTFEWSDWRCADWWWIQSVFVVRAARRSGVFKGLYETVRREAEGESGVCGIRLYVEDDNHRAQATYDGLGMQDARYRVMEDALPWVAAVVRKED